MGTVTKSLADPLADEALRHFHQSSEACDARVRRMDYKFQQASTPKALRGALRAYRDALAGHALCVLASSSAVVALLPRVVQDDQGSDVLRIEYEVTSPANLICKVALDITQHTLSRLFQRMNVLDLAAVRDALLMPSILAYGFALATQDDFQQFALPVQLPGIDGVLVGDVVRFDGGGRTLVARTFIRVGVDEDSRHARAYDVMLGLWTAGVMVEGTSEQCAMRCLVNPYGVAKVISASVLPDPNLAWLREPYEPRPDPLGEAWDAAERSRWLQ